MRMMNTIIYSNKEEKIKVTKEKESEEIIKFVFPKSGEDEEELNKYCAEREHSRHKKRNK